MLIYVCVLRNQYTHKCANNAAKLILTYSITSAGAWIAITHHLFWWNLIVKLLTFDSNRKINVLPNSYWLQNRTNYSSLYSCKFFSTCSTAFEIILMNSFTSNAKFLNFKLSPYFSCLFWKTEGNTVLKKFQVNRALTEPLKNRKLA